MKNLKRFIILLFFLAELKVFAQNNLNFTVQADFGFANGSVKEYVFDPQCNNTDDVMSLLDWDVKNIPVFDFKAAANIFKYGFLSAEGFFAIPKESGAMQDYDWLNCIDFKMPTEFGTELTNYSHHDNFLSQYYGFSAKIGANIFIPLAIINMRVTPFLFYYYEFIGFDGKNGYRTYKSEDWEKISFKGKVISYFQEINAFLFGVNFSVPVFDFFKVSGDFSISPKLTFINALDFHYVRKLAFLDKINNAFLLMTNLNVEFFFKKRHKIFVSGFLQYIPMQAGADYVRSITESGIYTSKNWMNTDSEGGTRRFVFKISLGIGTNL